MGLYFLPVRVGLIAVAVLAACTVAVRAQKSEPRICNEDAMIVFDASGSMYGDGWGYASTSRTSRIDNARSALAEVLPNITRFRRVGLMSFGPGPAGKTPLTSAVEQAANILEFRAKPGVIVVLTDGEETCGRSPCELGKRLHAEAAQLTIHVIGLRVKGFSWTGEQSFIETKYLAEQNNGLYLAVETEDELVADSRRPSAAR
jgi:Ca-activated chloride channel homolog